MLLYVSESWWPPSKLYSMRGRMTSNRENQQTKQWKLLWPSKMCVFIVQISISHNQLIDDIVLWPCRYRSAETHSDITQAYFLSLVFITILHNLLIALNHIRIAVFVRSSVFYQFAFCGVERNWISASFSAMWMQCSKTLSLYTGNGILSFMY